MSVPFTVITDRPRRWTIGGVMIGVALIALVLGLPHTVLSVLAATAALWWLPFLLVFGVPMLARADRRLWAYQCSVAFFPLVAVALVHIILLTDSRPTSRECGVMLLLWTTRALLVEAPAMLLGTLLVLIAGFERQRDSATIFERVAGPLMPVGAWSVCWLLFRADPFGAFAHLALLRL